MKDAVQPAKAMYSFGYESRKCAAEKARREAEARQMRIDAEKLHKVREILLVRGVNV